MTGIPEKDKNLNTASPEKSPSIECLYASEDDPLQLFGYRLNRGKQLLTWALILVTVGLLRLIFFWKPNWMLYCTHSPCTLDIADTALLFDKYEQAFVEDIRTEKDDSGLLHPTSNGKFNVVSKRRFLENRKTRYIWNYEERKFEKLLGLDFNYLQCSDICAQNGISKEEQKQRQKLFGVNLIEIKIESIAKIFFTEVLNPFYIYQFCAVGFWMADDYYYYASYILFMSSLSLALTTYQIRVNQRRLRDKVYGSAEVLVSRGKENYQRIDSSQLVPGDVVLLENDNSQLFCDSVLLSGEVIVNESMLTGESNPVTKTPIRDCQDIYDHKKDGKHILFCGTTLIQVRQLGIDRPRALVVRTNFVTAKGELVKSILYPKPIDFKFNRHINTFLFVLSILALGGFTYTVIIKVMRHNAFSEIVYKAIDLVTIVVPPELPAALTIAVIFVDKRLRNKQIFCMSPRSINISGCIDVTCFDKTGTLTEDAIDLHEIVQAKQSSSKGDIHFEAAIKDSETLSSDNAWLRCLASCHSLKLLKSTQLIGEDLEIKLFNWTKWNLEEPSNSEHTYGYTIPTLVSSPLNDLKFGVLKQFPFTSKAARMSVIITQLDSTPNEHFEFFIKGAPEVILPMCRPETVPHNFTAKLDEYTCKSYRVLAIASKRMAKMSQDQLESNSMEVYENELEFLGFVVMRNMLKTSTVATIRTLNEANIRSIMVTGDNLLTALSVARECAITKSDEDMIILEASQVPDSQLRPVISYKLYDQTEQTAKNGTSYSLGMGPNERYKLAMTGQTFKVIREHYPELISQVMVRGAIYARMAPEQKQQLVEMLQTVGYYVAMCGDGANDCGALKVAHAGISLSDTEASVASAFTSLNGQISCVIDLLREGRASLVSVYGIVRYMALYNLTSFLAIGILYWYHSALTDIQNLYQDVCLISLFIFLFGRTLPYHKLSPIRPSTSLINISNISSILVNLMLMAFFQFAVVFYLHQQDWYKERIVTGSEDTEENEDYVCHDNYAVFIIQIFQYVTLVIIFSKGAPYREPIYKNYLLSAAIVLSTLVTLALVLTPESPFPWIATFFGLAYEGFPHSFRAQIIGLNVVHFVVAIFAEKFIIEGFISKLARKYKRQPHEKIHSETYGLEWLPAR